MVNGEAADTVSRVFVQDIWLIMIVLLVHFKAVFFFFLADRPAGRLRRTYAARPNPPSFQTFSTKGRRLMGG